MNNTIESIRKTRIHLLKLVEPLSTEDLNRIPVRFNNNVIWNLGHVIAVQQSICYLKSNIEPPIGLDAVSLYKSGTKPDKELAAPEIQSLKNLLLESVDRLEADYHSGLFSEYPSWTTGYGIEIRNIDNAIDFVLFHEGLHRGYVMAMKRTL